jgi:hypothetical protein
MSTTKYACVTKIEKQDTTNTRQDLRSSCGTVHWKVSVEIGGFEGEGEGQSVGTAFQGAYEDVAAKLAAGRS